MSTIEAPRRRRGGRSSSLARREGQRVAAQANDLVTSIEAIAGSLPASGPVVDELGDLLAHFRTAAQLVADFDARYFTLEVASRPDRSLEQALELWTQLAPGRHQAGSPELEQLVRSSLALQPLTASGFKVPGVEKFSPAEVAVARALGDGFTRWHRIWDGLRFALNGGAADPSFRVAPQQVREALQMLRAMEQHEVVASFTLEMRKRASKGDSAWRAVDKFQSGWGYEWRCRILPGRRSQVNLVNGLWLNAYAHHVISDHLVSNDVPHELLTDVGYQTPGDVVEERGDFDVIGRFDDTLLLVECKSGRLDAKSAELQKVIAKDRSVRAALREMDGEVDLVSLLVFNPYRCADRAALVDALAGTGVVAVEPSELRSAVRKLGSNVIDLGDHVAGQRIRRDNGAAR